jgi:hypothetical protein
MSLVFLFSHSRRAWCRLSDLELIKYVKKAGHNSLPNTSPIILT